MVRNKTPFYYALHKGQVEIIDEYGNATGEYMISYDEPVMALGNISAAQGEIQSRQFGESESYDKVIVLDDKDAPIDEYTVLWVDTLPQPNKDTPYDYIVRKVARSLNSVSIAISKVSVR
jgi:hypothetical protein